MLITPIDQVQQADVNAEVQRYVGLAAELYQQSFAPVTVSFDLRGRAAGIYHCHYSSGWFPKRNPLIRFNPWLFAKYPEDSWVNTVPHEVAHYISDCLYDLRRIKPHGSEWQQIMRDFGAEPLVRGDYDLAGIPMRQVKRFAYGCECRVVELSSYRHNKVQRGQQQYRCRDCASTLVYQG